ncbi:AraC family transcriptional regulator with amidase-like domain [Murinocardiopsis flavida]|uniref:AraC family transcriptional regulator with amidase-like domain n=1 Tax=Murinocardiopsis flavida TaxID=645275 RepID=A0A2P8D3C9_9ACTN|nr:helix-turn-helix domain-containing protein [Murinocardiopsis flavida]PSK91725.1 AraC family transcriptional regulator with amidase-like domain [Murinocardiopsis flavida]
MASALGERESKGTEGIRTVVPVLADSPLFELAVPCEVFGKERFDLDPRWYELTLCATAPGPQNGPGGLRLEVDAGVEALDDADLVVVPACRMPDYRPPEDLLAGLRAAHARGARIAAVCSGAFVLAEAGLLDGKEATTHWMYAEELRRRHPRVLLVEDALYVDTGSVLTSAGTAAGIDLCLHIVRSDFGAAVAADVGRRMVAAPHREAGQSQYAPDPPPRSGVESGLAPVLDWAVERLHEPLTVPQLAGRAGMSLRTFGRHFARETGVTPLAWLNRQRLAKARELLETTDLSVDAVAQRSGLGGGDLLRQHFHRHLGSTPAAYRRTFRSGPPTW